MIYLISYSPLANSRHGRGVAARNGIAPYVDASCRREPDFELDRPFISGLCRQNFIPTLKRSDILVYVTNRRPIHRDGRRLVAILRLDQQFDSHVSAATAYQLRGQRIPYSCVLPENPPLPIHLTDPRMTRTTANFKDSKVWDRAVYVERAKRCVRCFSCEPLFVELQKPPTVDDEFWNQWFGSDPGTRMQNGGISLEKPVYDALLRHSKVL